MEKDPAAVSLGRKGGKARAANLSAAQRSEAARDAAIARSASLTPERRSEIARAAVAKRWEKK